MVDKFEAVWESVCRYAGQTFASTSGQPFYYDVKDGGIAVRRSDMFFSKDDIEKQFREASTSAGRGQAAYINGSLRDIRIRS